VADEWWRTTAYCFHGHGVQPMQVIESIKKTHNQQAYNVVGYLACGDRFTGVTVSMRNAGAINQLRRVNGSHS
jgi:hypothetical protein